MAAAKGAGVDLLQHLSQVIIEQKTCRLRANKYLVKTADDDVLFTLTEIVSHPALVTKRRNRGFHIDAADSLGSNVFSLRCPTAYAPDKLEVSMGGQVVSVVRKEPTFMTPLFYINDVNDTPQLRVKAEYRRYEFQLQTPDKAAIGSISKKFAGVLQELFTYSDNYVIIFPADLSLQYKVATIAACIFIDYSYHEH